MVLNNFRLNVVFRVALLVALGFVSVWGVVGTVWVATPMVCAALLLICTVELIHYVERGARELSVFLTCVAHHDFSVPTRVAGKGRIFDELQGAYRLLAEQFQRLNLQKAANHQYLAAVVEHVAVALCCFDAQGSVTMINEPARRLFGVPHLGNVRSFERIDLRLPDTLRDLGDGERTLLNVQRGDDSLQLVLYATTFELLEQRYKLVSFQNIRDELDRQEIDSWQRLIRVLTHEIMNSVTPIISLSGVIRDTMIDDSTSPPTFRALQPQERDDMLRSVTAIHARSSGLLEFVQAYRSFAKLPTPEFASVDVGTLLRRVRTLMSQETDAHRIVVDIDCAEGALAISADARQAEQIMINLVRNAVDALGSVVDPRIGLRALRDDQGRVLVQVSDNGPGIAQEHLDSIFVPFFTTKRNGTGVGLSVSRQLMQANRGFIAVRSAPGEGTVFTLKFVEAQ